jgi:hypothetical protein
VAQAAEFLGCKGVEEDILNHLCTLLIDTLKRSEESFALQSASSDGFLEANPAYGRDWHNMQVRACTELLVLIMVERKKRTGLTEGRYMGSCKMPQCCSHCCRCFDICQNDSAQRCYVS